MEALTAPLSAAINSLFPRSPRTPKSQAMDLPKEGSIMLAPDDSEKVELRIEGMTCGACVESIESMMRVQDGIHSIRVALLAERAVVEYDPTKWTVEKIISEICDIGFDATQIPPSRSDSITLRIYGMTCGSCTSTVETQLGAMPGVISVSVSLTTETAHVLFDRSLVNPREMVERIEDMGFDAMVSDQADATQKLSLSRTKEIQEWRHKFQMSAAFAVPVFFISMVAPMIPLTRPIVNCKFMQGIYLGDCVAFVLTVPVQFWLGRRFYRNAYKSLKHGSATMDVLVVLGTSAAFIYSVFAMFFATWNSDPEFHPSVFFDTSTMLIAFVSLGRYLENLAKGRTSAALTDLMALAPSMAVLYTDAPECTKEKKIATELLQVGDMVKIVPGDRIPADGTVTKGASSVDESAVTGEPVPVFKQIGDPLIAGTMNGLGTFDMVITRAGKDTALAQIVKLVEDAQTSKAPIQAFADKVAGYFVPSVITLALITFIGWMIISHWIIPEDALPTIFHHPGASKLAVCLKLCISVVVVACPCALGLSTPTAIMVGTGMGAKNGILIKGGRALEASKNITRIVLDKTGTVTEGKLKVVSLAWVPHASTVIVEPEAILTPATHIANKLALQTSTTDASINRLELCAAIAAVEARSEHPLAKAIATYTKDVLAGAATMMEEPEIDITNFESVTGAGVKADIQLQLKSTSVKKLEISVGTSSFVSDYGLPVTLTQFEAAESKLGRTVIFVSLTCDGKKLPALAISLSDLPKPSSAQAIAAFHKMGMEVYLMTGDSDATARAIAEQVGIKSECVSSRMSPQGKARMVTDLINGGKGGVAMVGDGINDSPALVAATVGIALSSGTSVAVEAADIVLMRADLLDIVAAFHLARAIFSTIRRNLVWACIYNVLGIPLAMGIFLPWGINLHPMMAGAAMAFSSVSVVSSSLLLKWWRRPVDSVMPGEKVEGETLLDSFKIVLGDAWDSFKSSVRSGRKEVGYTQVPVEMSSV